MAADFFMNMLSTLGIMILDMAPGKSDVVNYVSVPSFYFTL